MQRGVSVREGTILWSEHSAVDADLHWISLIHSVTHDLSIRTHWRTPLHSHLERHTTQHKTFKPNFKDSTEVNVRFHHFMIQLLLVNDPPGLVPEASVWGDLHQREMTDGSLLSLRRCSPSLCCCWIGERSCTPRLAEV